MHLMLFSQKAKGYYSTLCAVLSYPSGGFDMKALSIYFSMLFLFGGVWIFAQASPALGSPIVVDRNLFAPDRKPTPPDSGTPAAQSTTPAVPPKALQLDGIIVYGSTKKALVRMKGQVPGQAKGKEASPFISVREGEKVSDYVVTKIGMKSISVEKGGQTFDINLFATGKILPPLPAPPPQQTVNEPPPGDPRGQRPPDQPPNAGGQAGGVPSPDPMNLNSGGGNVGRQAPQMTRRRSNVNPPTQMNAPDEEVDVEADQEEVGGDEE
jgi:hypothetical protein